MTALTIQTSGDPIGQLQTASRDLEKAADFAGKSATRKLRSEGARHLRETAGINRASANRRVHRYLGGRDYQASKVWFGTQPVVAPTSFVAASRAKRGKRGLLVDGRPVPGGFMPSKGRFRRLPLLAVAPGESAPPLPEDARLRRFSERGGSRIFIIVRDISEASEEAFRRTAEQTDDVVQDEMRRAIGRTLAR